MTLTINIVGKTIATTLPTTPGLVATSTPKTISEVLAASPKEKDCPMWCTVLQTFANKKNVPVEQLTLEALIDGQDWFRHELVKAHYKYNSIRSYCNYLLRFVARAKLLGWSPAHSEMAGAWKDIFAVMPKSVHRRLKRHVIRLGKLPPTFLNSDLDLCVQKIVEEGWSYRYAFGAKRAFLCSLSKNGLAEKVPQLTCPSSGNHAQYGIPLDCFPAQLQAEVKALLHWKQMPYRKGRHRPITALSLESSICRLYGFAVNVQKRSVISLTELITKESIEEFQAFLLQERGVKGYSLVGVLRLLHAALKHYPPYKQQDFGWLGQVISEIYIPPENETEIRNRKLLKYVDYEILREALAHMHDARKEAAKHGFLALARHVHNELLLSFLVTLVWRQRNIRECRIGHNLFWAPIPPLVNMTLRPWVQQAIKENPQQQFLQFYFREAETKAGRAVRSIVPPWLVPLVEEYLGQYRPALLSGSDPGTVFLNQRGRPLTAGQLEDLVSKITLTYVQRRVNPHMFRDIFAFWWLSHYPEDINTVSKMLWHKNIQTTIGIYGWKYDESAALCRVEECLEQHTKQSGVQPLQLAKTKSSGGEILPLPKAAVTKTLAPGSVIGGGFKKVA